MRKFKKLLVLLSIFALIANFSILQNIISLVYAAPATTVYPTSSSAAPGETVTITSSGDAANQVWFAPAGTTTFTEGATMTRAASGTSTSILAPATAGDYKLFVLDSNGNAKTGTEWAEVGTNAISQVARGSNIALTLNSTIYSIGGFDGSSNALAKVYSSTDGLTWTEVGTNAFPGKLSEHAGVVFNNKLWTVGGYDTTAGAYSRKVYSSPDGLTWTEAGTNSFPFPLGDHNMTVFDSKMWVVGGYNDTSGLNSAAVYSSTDGITWTNTGNLPQVLNAPGVMTFNSKLWAVGGFSGSNSRKVFSSPDGVTWTESGTNVLPVAMGDNVATAVYNGRMFIIHSNDVYYSTDGTTWTTLANIIPSTISRGVNENNVVVLNGMWIIGKDSTNLGKVYFSDSHVSLATLTVAATPTPTPIPSSSGSSSTSTSTSTSPATCTNIKPVGAPNLFQMQAGNTQITLYFAPVNDGTVTSYFIAYGYSSGDERFGTFTSQGQSTGAIAYTINFLSPNTTYYVKVRPHSGCMPGNWSNEMKVTTGTVGTFFNTIPEAQIVHQVAEPTESTPFTNSVPVAAPVESPDAPLEEGGFWNTIFSFFGGLFER